jgi:hypothetical protein
MLILLKQIEQQLKIYIDSMQFKIDEADNEKKQLKDKCEVK